MTDEATLFTGAEEAETQADPDESLINALNGDDDSNDDTKLFGDEPELAVAETYKVKINGKEKDVTREELIAHYQKNEAAQEKFEQAAQIRREAEAQRNEYLQHQQLMAQVIQQIQQQAQQWDQEGQPNWADLLENNPHEYLRQKTKFEQRQQTLQQVQAAQAYLQQQQQSAQLQNMQEYLGKENTKLVTEHIPEWSDKAVREKEEGELISFLKEKGYNDNDLVNLSHSRASNIKLAFSAMKYEKLLAKAKAAKKASPPVEAYPVPTVSGKASANKDPTHMTDSEFAAWRRAQQKRR